MIEVKTVMFTFWSEKQPKFSFCSMERTIGYITHFNYITAIVLASNNYQVLRLRS